MNRDYKQLAGEFKKLIPESVDILWDGDKLICSRQSLLNLIQSLDSKPEKEYEQRRTKINRLALV